MKINSVLLLLLALAVGLTCANLSAKGPPLAGPWSDLGGMISVDSGSHFYLTDATELGSAASQVYLVETALAASSTKQIHLVFSADGSAITQFTLSEETDRVGVTTGSITHSNRQRIGISTSTLLIFKGAQGGTTDGNVIWQYKGGAAAGASRSPVGAGRLDEIILKPGTK